MVTGKTLGRYLKESPDLAKKAGIPVSHMMKAITTIEKEIESNRRQPAPTPPDGAISQSEGARKYQVPQRSISRWVTAGYIPVILRTKKEVYIDEERLSEIAKTYRRNPGRGKRTIQHKFSAEVA